MKLIWSILKILTGFVVPEGSEESLLLEKEIRGTDDVLEDEETDLFERIMKTTPGHFGRFVSYIYRLIKLYDVDEAYLRFRHIQQKRPDLLPNILFFAGRCLRYIIQRFLEKRYFRNGERQGTTAAAIRLSQS